MSLWFNGLNNVFPEPFIYFSILELALLYVPVDELKKTESDELSVRFMSQFLDLLSLSKDYWHLTRNRLLVSLYLDD